MTKTYCDICGEEINTNRVFANVYQLKMNPFVQTSSTTRSEMNFEYNEICYDCASEIAAQIKAMKKSS